MSATVIGVDPHKRSHTAVVLDDCEQVASEIRVTASGGQVDELLAWAPAPASGCGRSRTPTALVVCWLNSWSLEAR